MKTLQKIVFLILLSTSSVFSQDNLIHEILGNKSVLHSLVAYQILKPSKIYLFDKTDEWNKYRFQIASFPSGDFSDEHHPYNHTYFFKDKRVSKLFKKETNSLNEKSNSLKIKLISISPIKGFEVVHSINTVKNGLLMTFSEPIISENKQYCFVELKTYQVSKTDKDFYSSEGLILKKINNKWQPFHKVGGMIF